MKRPLSVLPGIIFLLFSLTATSQWRTIYQGADTTNDIVGASFYAPKDGWIATTKYAGFTQDSGKTFIQRPVTLNNVDYNQKPVNLTFGFSPSGVKAFSQNELLLYGDYGAEPSILYSSNGGQTWKVVFHKPLDVNTPLALQTVLDMQFPQSSSTGYAVHGNGVLKTTDGGKNWQSSNFTGYELLDIDFVSESTGYLLGNNRLFVTTNAGLWWNGIGGVPQNATRIDFVTATTGYVFTREGIIYRTTNGGASWTAMNTAETAFGPAAVHFTDENTGYAAGGLYSLHKTENGGRTWEEMEGSRSFEYLYYSFKALAFYDNNLAWACGARDYLMKTDNAGGRTYPRAQFQVDKSLYCPQNLIQLQSRSLETNPHRWYRNGVLFATGYNASYTPGLTPDTIMLVVENALGKDTATQTISETSNTGFTFESRLRDTFSCAAQQHFIDIPNSDPALTYQVCRVGGGCWAEQRGTGGTLALGFSTDPRESGPTEFTVTARRVNSCGTTSVTHSHSIRLATTQITVQASADTFCPQKPVIFIRVANSLPDYNYWADPSFPKVAGNGGELLLPVRSETGKPPSSPFDKLNIEYKFQVSADYALLACPSGNPKTVVSAIARSGEAKFFVQAHEYFTGEGPRLVNQSRQATNYTWTFSEGSSNNQTTEAEPAGIYWTTPGQKQIRLDAYTREGCLHSATSTEEVFQNTAPGQTIQYCSQDSLESGNYHENRSIYEDEYGNYYLTGGRKELSAFQFYPSGGEGWFLYKFNKDHQLEWKLEQRSVDAFEYNSRHHIVFENVVTDRYGYIYLLGQAYNNTYVTDGDEQYPIQRACTVFMKVSPHGKIVWVKQLFIDPTYWGLHFTGGTLLRGKNDDFYIITQQRAGADKYRMDDQVLLSYSYQTGVILRVDANGTVLDKKQYPSQYHEMFIYSDGENYDRTPRAMFDSLGRIVLYTKLDPAEISGGRIDDAVLGFDPVKIPSALLYFDTATKRMVDVKPVYRLDSTGQAVGVEASSIALDGQGNYYAGWVEKEELMPATQFYRSIKPKGRIAAYSAQGEQLWIKRTEGLEPQSLQAMGNKLFVLGQNYIGYGFSLVGMNYYSTQTPVDTNVQKITAIYDNAYRSTGVHGIGAADIVLARLEAASGTVEAISVQGTKKEEDAFLVQKGYGDQLILTGQGSFSFYSLMSSQDVEKTSRLYVMRTPAGTDCTTAYRTQARFLLFDRPSRTAQCTDSLVRLRWSSYDVETVQLYYSRDSGATYQLLAGDVAGTVHEKVINLDQLPLTGHTLFKIVDKNHPALSDTLTRIVGRRPVGFSLTATPGERSCLSDKVTLASTATCSDCSVLWNTGDTTRSITVTRSGWYQVKYSNGCGAAEGYKDVTIYPMPEIKLSVSDTTVCEGSRVYFGAAGAGWDFHWSGPRLTASHGDTTSALVPSGTSAYTLIANNGYGCQQTKTVTITANPVTAPSPTVSVSYSGCGTGPLVFTATAENAGTAPVYEWKVNGVVSGGGPTLTLSSITAGTQVQCTVTVNGGCAPGNTASASVTVNCTTTGLPSVDGMETYSVSPNPSAGLFVVRMKLNTPKEVQYTVRDAQGRIVYQSATAKHGGSILKELDLTRMAAGVYYLTVRVGNEEFTDKLVKW